MGQIHQHLVLFNHIALNHQAVFLEHIPHLKQRFVSPAKVHGGYYETPLEPGASSDMIVSVGEAR
jgi:L-fuconate dehydratase